MIDNRMYNAGTDYREQNRPNTRAGLFLFRG